jgi:CRISPR-associated endonuclease Csn1
MALRYPNQGARQDLPEEEPKDEIMNSLDPAHKSNIDIFALRKKSLDERLTNTELFKVIYHIAKRRGYKSNRKNEAEIDKSAGPVIDSIKKNEQLLVSKQYRTAGEAIYLDEKFTIHKRNKSDGYINSFARQDYEYELNMILKSQIKLGLNLSEEQTKQLLYSTENKSILFQRPFITEELINKMLGECTFEKNEKRTPKASFSFEKFRFINDLSNIVFKNRLDGSSMILSEDQIGKIFESALEQKDITYKKIRDICKISLDYEYTYIRGKISDQSTKEKNLFGSLKAYHAIKKSLVKLPDDWDKIKNDTNALNEITTILTTQKTDDGIKAKLDILSVELSSDAKNELSKLTFSGFAHLSIKALENIIPYIEKGMSYDKACEASGYDFRKKLADMSQITNPVVKRAISQTIKVIRAVKIKYGDPYFVKIEATRDLAKNFSDRNKIKHQQDDNNVANNKVKDRLVNEFDILNPTGLQITKYKLYAEQNGKCMYSGDPIDINLLFSDQNAYDIDHILPYSRSGNDSRANKALVKSSENRQKGDKTPYEAFGFDTEKWLKYEKQAETLYKTQEISGDSKTKSQKYAFNGYAMTKKNNLLNKKFESTDWNARALNDTRYISRFVQNYVKNSITFANGPEKTRVITPNGTMTAYIRARWGLKKDRQEDVLHHAKDAAVVAVIDHKLIQKVNIFAKAHEISDYLKACKTIKEKTDKLTGEISDDSEFEKSQRIKNAIDVLHDKHFPSPWDDFTKELNKRTLLLDKESLQNELRGLEQYDDNFRLQCSPIFVSRMPVRKGKGSAHQETLRSPKDENNISKIRKPLSAIHLKDLENSPTKNTDTKLYETIKKRLTDNSDNPLKAFSSPIYKPGDDKNPIRSIKIYTTEPSGYYINDGKAFVNNGSMICLDIFSKKTKDKTEHFFVPIYAHQIKGKRPTKILPEPKGFTDIDDNFTKVATVFPNDYLIVSFSDGTKKEGYYVGYNSASGQLNLLKHSATSKEYTIRCSARSASSIKRLDVSILGDNYWK